MPGVQFPPRRTLEMKGAHTNGHLLCFLPLNAVYVRLTRLFLSREPQLFSSYRIVAMRADARMNVGCLYVNYEFQLDQNVPV